ncbi:HlyD family secretion protein [Phyllobacterium myrsinacearum]|uniref:Multidrug resistance efflux pump n=1 Tax=Phyllobacterium myrsinacearum TaxID=28101 RepID=A0A839ERS3_9HYPH|nr:HlyD family efflux transporter periplasmic adaptor subunit [Phyllobacterium myrsinacearum]MBA8879300.1 multidrug resistance efflux pump [Phyllobacterium myrsinacearum]
MTMFSRSTVQYTVVLTALAGAGLLLWSTSNATETHQAEITSAKPNIIAAARGIVDVEGGLLRLSTPRDGMIEQVRVKEGQRIERGDILATLDNRRELIAVRTSEAELRQTKGQLDALQAKLNAQTRQVARFRRAAAGNAISAQALDEAEAQLAGLKSEVVIAEAILAAAESRVDNSRLEVEMRLVRAPVAARIIRLSAWIGEVVSTQGASELFTLLPEAPIIVRAEIQEQFVKLVEPDMYVDIISENDDIISVPGRVKSIQQVLEQPKSRDTPGDRVDIRTAECIINIQSKSPFLIGQRVVIRFKPRP